MNIPKLITKKQLISFGLMLISVCWPVCVFIVLCTGMFLAFDYVLLWLDEVAPWFIGGAWLSLLVAYIALGIAFILFSARWLRHLYGSRTAQIQGRIAVLSGLPFYVVWLLFVVTSIYSMFDPNIGGAAAFFSVAGFLGFALISFGYLLLLFFFMGIREQIVPIVFLPIRLCWPACVLIGLCLVILCVLDPASLGFGQVTPWFSGGGWLLLLSICLILYVAFTFFSVRRLRGLYGSQTVQVQGSMATLSGLPFYAICLLFLLIIINAIRDPAVDNGAMFFGVAGFAGFVLVSLSYLLSLFFFLDLLRPVALLISNWRVRKS